MCFLKISTMILKNVRYMSTIIIHNISNLIVKIGKQKYEQQKLTLFEKIVDPILDILIRKKIK